VGYGKWLHDKALSKVLVVRDAAGPARAAGR
jgi:hypothetical protein